jgi:hypothetical protein
MIPGQCLDRDADALRLRRARRDLVALSAIPAAWVGREPTAIAAGLADVLVNSLYLDFAFVRLRDPKGHRGRNRTGKRIARISRMA